METKTVLLDYWIFHRISKAKHIDLTIYPLYGLDSTCVKQYIVAHIIVKFWMNMGFLILQIDAFNIIVYVSDKISFMFESDTKRFDLFK